MPFDRRISLASPTGATLNVHARQAEGRPRAVVQVNHGLAEHAGRYARFADFLAARDLGFDLVQGYLFGRPMPARKFARKSLSHPVATPN